MPVGLTGDWDARISRRTLLRTGGSAVAGLYVLGRTAPAKAHPPYVPGAFSLGVASGDPAPDGVVLWTRLAPEPLDGGGIEEDPYGVRWEIAEDPDFQTIVQRGAEQAVPEEAFSVHAEVGGLEPDTWYWYRFAWGRVVSPVGRTRTAPALGSSPERLRFAFVSCQNFAHGYYPAFADLAQQDDIELVVQLGDYIYEGNGVAAFAVRPHVPRATLVSLEDYRTRHAQYRTDPDLQAAHAAFPWLMTWDDHEVINNYANLNIGSLSPAAAAVRRAAAYQAYWEHAPLSRARKPVGKDMGLYRREPWGELATFHVLDTRQYRDKQPVTCTVPAPDPGTAYCPTQLDPAKTILGAAQRDWLLEGLGGTAAWNILANQVGFAPQITLDGQSRKQFGLTDSWDGYVADRQRVLSFLKEHGIRNTVVITGDKHEHTVRNVAESYADIAGNPIATEFVGSSISTDNDPANANPTYGTANNPHILFESFQRGYVRVELDRQAWHSDMRVVDTVKRRENVPARTLSSWVVENGKPGAIRTFPAV
jgi:alkaline phosphatase D